MPASILSYATAADSSTGSYLTNVTRAVKSCLTQAAIEPDDVAVLINTGVYRDSNIVEPAIAALIQQRVGAGLTYRTGYPSTLSFDLINGGCGLLDAFTLAETLFATDDLRYIVVTAGEAHPSIRRDVDGFPYTVCGAAMLLGRSKEGGFGRQYTSSAGSRLTPFGLIPLAEMGSVGRSTIHINSGPPDSLDSAVRAIRECVEGEDIDLSQVHILAPLPTPDFAGRLAQALHVDRNSVHTPDPHLGNPLSAAPIFAYASADRGGASLRDQEILWLGADGHVSSCIRYRHYSIQATFRSSDDVWN